MVKIRVLMLIVTIRMSMLMVKIRMLMLMVSQTVEGLWGGVYLCKPPKPVSVGRERYTWGVCTGYTERYTGWRRENKQPMKGSFCFRNRTQQSHRHAYEILDPHFLYSRMRNKHISGEKTEYKERKRCLKIVQNNLDTFMMIILHIFTERVRILIVKSLCSNYQFTIPFIWYQAAPCRTILITKSLCFNYQFTVLFETLPALHLQSFSTLSAPPHCHCLKKSTKMPQYLKRDLQLLRWKWSIKQIFKGPLETLIPSMGIRGRPYIT